jgi:transposase
MAGRKRVISLPTQDRRTLERWVRLALRSRIVLLLGQGLGGRAVARRLGISRHTVDLWGVRYQKGGCDALVRDRPGRGRKPQT